ncbi:MAG: permease-like cell division protein FtsX [Cyclobacteriaceae bacterium]|nr:permease-like cell division protein FtsX [Cyclobacteriaceae bacterium]MCB0500712.1 permease-like cell division protein FtsX [Cyclobacteriaceae bacterium]MCB9236586.1 ABC transporter permease [Flammeovirgaceae bacterium]MCO5273154.1 permease-like cell division protein FtsX [Cyclobacteriaceae bacterium]MCW5903251.1 permease-like cell division protein FtsX [Cyclobacteriaceae bacterium]
MVGEAPKFKVKKKKLGSYPYFSVVFSITLALFVIGVFGALIIYSKELERVVRESVKVQVFLQSRVTEAQRLQIQKTLTAKPFTAKNRPHGAVQFISKEDAARQFIEETGEDFQQFLGENPLRDAFLVSIDEAYHDASKLKAIKAEVEKINGVFQVYYVESVIDSINKNVTKISIILLGIALLLLSTVVLLINNTVRLALFSQRFLIRSMQLVGATGWFIQRPFLYRSMAHGLLAGAVASGLLVGLIALGNQRIEDLQLIQNTERLAILIVVLLVTGIIVALLSTLRAVNKYLKLSLDQLY